jgi:hypothetical protein
MTDTKTILIPAETVEDLAAAIRRHIVDKVCDRDHDSMFDQVPIIEFNPGLSTLACKVCGNKESLLKPPAEGGSIDTYVCRLLRQQSIFYTLHFASCAETKGGIA